MPISVFLSHAKEDIELITKVEQHMRPLEVRVYKYEDDPQGGTPLAVKLQQRIRECDVVVVLLTRNSQARPSVHTEVGIARGLGKPIIPVIEIGIDPQQFTFLQGLEWVLLDPAHLDTTLLQLQLGVKQFQDARRTNAQLAGVLLVIVGLLLIYWASSQNTLPGSPGTAS
jgi:hypothetical protein